MKKNFLFCNFIFIFIFCACSSLPKNSMAVTTSYQRASSRYELANNQLTIGNLNDAGDNLLQAYNTAVAIDRWDLLSKVCISAAVYTMNLNDSNLKSKFKEKTADDFLQEAKYYAQLCENEILISIVEIYQVKVNLKNDKKNFSEYKKKLDSAQEKLAKEKKEKYYLGYLYRTQGDLAFAKNNYEEAAQYFVKAAEVHTDGRFLYEISLDWYYAARAFNFAKNKKEAIKAIEQALKYDRDAENSVAISEDYRAYAKILQRGIPTEEERKKAKIFTERADEIDEARKKILVTE